MTFGPPTGAVKTGKNRLHDTIWKYSDIAPPAGGDQPRKSSVSSHPEARPRRHPTGRCLLVVLADPEGNEFCLLTPR